VDRQEISERRFHALDQAGPYDRSLPLRCNHSLVPVN
jgi:hypothetical protein